MKIFFKKLLFISFLGWVLFSSASAADDGEEKGEKDPAPQEVFNKSLLPKDSSPMILAVIDANLTGIRKLVETQYITDKRDENRINEKDDFGWTPLMYAAVGGNFDVVQCLIINGGAKINLTTSDPLKLPSSIVFKEEFDDGGCTPLMAAASYGHARIVAYLFSHSKLDGSDVNAMDIRGWTALEHAAKNGHLDVVKFLAEDSTPAAKNQALTVAVKEGHVDMVQYLHEERDARVDPTKNDGQTALIIATSGGHADTVEFILKNEAETINSRDKTDSTALILATRNAAENHSKNAVHIFRLLTDAGADLTLEDKTRKSALWWAVSRGRVGMATRLVSTARLDTQVDEKTILMTAVNAKYNKKKPHDADQNITNMVSLLFESRASISETGVDVQDKEGYTALMYAASNGYMGVVKYLVAEGADTNAKDSKSLTASEIAKRKGHQDVAKCLDAEVCS